MIDTMTPPEPMVRIWSGEHGLFWRPGAAGYTRNPAEAGQWSFSSAQALTRHCGPEKKIELKAVRSGPLFDLLVAARARDVNSRLVRAWMRMNGLSEEPWPDVSDITQAEAAACGAIVSAADKADRALLPPGKGFTLHSVVAARDAPRVLAHVILEHWREVRREAREGTQPEAGPA